jgi:hypothetical protein
LDGFSLRPLRLCAGHSQKIPKAVDKNHQVHARPLRPHLVLARMPVGLVLNFGLEWSKNGSTRMVNGLPD